jgi:hypothetical protein
MLIPAELADVPYVINAQDNSLDHRRTLWRIAADLTMATAYCCIINLNIRFTSGAFTPYNYGGPNFYRSKVEGPGSHFAKDT